MLAIFLTLLFCSPDVMAARKSLSYLKAHNFRLSSAESAEDWLLQNPLEASSTWKAGLLYSQNPDVPSLYSDLSSKDSTKIQNRLQNSYGNPYDAEFKAFLRWRSGKFEQSFSINAAAALLVNDPVFPELSGVLYNDYALASSYRIVLPFGITVKPILSYGLRRVMEHSFSVGQLLGQKPNLKIKTYPYRFFAEFSAKAFRPFSWGELLVEATALPVRQDLYDYWDFELGYRSPNLVNSGGDWPRRWLVWGSFSPIYGGTYDLVRSVKFGTTVDLFRFVQIDLFAMDGFRPAAILRVGTYRWNLQAFTFARAEDNGHVFQSRQYGLSLNGAF